MNHLSLLLSLLVILIATCPAALAQTANEPLNRAMSEMQAGRTDKAIAALTEAISQEPDNADAYFLRSNLRLTSNDTSGALADINKVIQLKPDHGAAYHQRAMIRLMAKDLDGVIQDLDSAINFGFKGDSVYGLRAQIKLQKGDPTGAVADLNEAIRLNPHDPKNYSIRGYALMRIEDNDQALKDFDFLLNWYETEPFKKVGAPSGATSDPAASQKSKPGSFAVGIQVDTSNVAPGDSSMINYVADAYSSRGTIRGFKGDHDAAISDFTKSIRLNAKNVWVFYSRANEYEVKGDLEAALADVSRAIQLDPLNGNLRVEHGVILVLMGREQEAKVDFDMLRKADADLWQKRIDDRLETVKKKMPAKKTQSP